MVHIYNGMLLSHKKNFSYYQFIVLHNFTYEKLCLVLRIGKYINYIIAFEGFTEQFDNRMYIYYQLLDFLSDMSNDSVNGISQSSWV